MMSGLAGLTDHFVDNREVDELGRAVENGGHRPGTAATRG